jgi:tetratricopeptide (TPR) repeat protein/GTPase SAR1 family protein
LSLKSLGNLKDFRDYFKNTIEGESDIKKSASDTLASLSSSKLPDAQSQISSFGIGFGLSILGRYLYSKKKESHKARIIANILGAPVDEMNTESILQKMKDTEYRNTTIRKNILDVIKTSSIDEFARGVNLSPGEAWEVYRQIKDLVIDSEIIGMVSRLHSETATIETIETVISNQARDLRTAIDKQLDEISKLQSQIYQTNGLSWLPRNYFEDHVSTAEDTKNWKNGFAFSLSSIKQEKEFRRSALINDIKSRLESRRRLLLTGQSGTSKTTILMEILTDYFDKDYEILYNFDGAEIKNGPLLVNFIQDRLASGDKILVVVDNVHSERTSAIFYAMDEIISSFTFIQNIRFLLAARIPEYESLVKDRLNKVGEGKESIIKFSKDPEFRYTRKETKPYDPLFFTKDEIKGFIKKYTDQTKMMTSEDDESLNNLSEKILKDTRGHPIMIKFFLLQGGLRTDVKRKYDDYLSGDARAMRIQIMLVCSFLDIGGLPITDGLLQDMGILREVYNIKNATLYRPTEGSWKTIHTRWDEELISFLYDNKSDEINEGQLYDNKQYLRNALDSIFNIKEHNLSATQERTYSVIGTVYDIAARNFMPIDIIESELPPLPSYLTNEKKAELYAYYIAYAYQALNKFQDAIEKLNEALILVPNFIGALGNKGYVLNKLGKYNEALGCYDKAIEIDSSYFNIWKAKGYTLYNLGKYNEAIGCYDKAIEIDPNDANVWYNKGYTLYNLGKYNEAIGCYDKAIEIDPNDAIVWNDKGIVLQSLERQIEADRCFAKAKELGLKPIKIL